MWRVNFPLVRDPDSGIEMMALSAYAVPNPSGGAPVWAECHCMDQQGRTTKLFIALAHLAASPRVYLLEDRNPDPTASGLIVDFTVKP